MATRMASVLGFGWSVRYLPVWSSRDAPPAVYRVPALREVMPSGAAGAPRGSDQCVVAARSAGPPICARRSPLQTRSPAPFEPSGQFRA